MVNSADLEGILGPRPWRSTELRNIDKFRDGFGQPRVPAAAAAAAGATEAAASSASS